MTKIIIKPNELKAIALFALKDASRSYINGVCFEFYDNCQPALIATNGHVLGVYRGQKNKSFLFQYTMRLDDITHLLKLAKLNTVKKSVPEIELEFIENKITATLTLYNEIVGKHTYETGAAPFPDWRIIPTYADNVGCPQIQFNTEYLALFGQAKMLLLNSHLPCVIIESFNKSSPAIITFENNEDFAGVIMPIRF